MIKQELKDYLTKIINEWPEDTFEYVFKHSIYSYLLDEIEKLYPQITSDEYTIKTKVYFAFHCLDDFPKCGNENCNNVLIHTNVSNLNKGFKKYCCKKCMHD